MFYLIFTHFVVWPETSRNLKSEFSSSIVQVGQYGPLVVASEECCGDIVGKPKSQTSQIIKPSNYGLVTFQRIGHLEFFSVKGPKNFKGFPREPRLNHQPFEAPIVSYLELSDCLYQPLVPWTEVLRRLFAALWFRGVFPWSCIHHLCRLLSTQQCGMDFLLESLAGYCEMVPLISK